MKVKTILSAFFLVSDFITISVFADEVPGVNGYVRVGIIETKDQAGESARGSALGGKLGYITLGPVNTNPMRPVVSEKAPIKAHPKGTSFGARGERFGYSK
ncbi:MAG: hypothetical protein ABW087_21330 [Candidatus Thiodiazotropha sp.]